MYNESPVKNNIVVNTRCGTGCIGDYKEGGDRYVTAHLSFSVHRIIAAVNLPLDSQLVSTSHTNGNLATPFRPTLGDTTVPMYVCTCFLSFNTESSLYCPFDLLCNRILFCQWTKLSTC